MVNDDPNVRETFVRKGRRYVSILGPIKGRRTMPYANYVWLKGNPSFLEIPDGYVIHHLDGNELNDDISNLAIMQKHHHAAYHFKQKILKPELKLIKDSVRIQRTAYFPLNEPKVKRKKHDGKYIVSFTERTDGKSKTVNLCSWEGKVFKTEEMAMVAKEAIWRPFTLANIDPKNDRSELRTEI